MGINQRLLMGISDGYQSREPFPCKVVVNQQEVAATLVRAMQHLLVANGGYITTLSPASLTMLSNNQDRQNGYSLFEISKNLIYGSESITSHAKNLVTLDHDTPIKGIKITTVQTSNDPQAPKVATNQDCSLIKATTSLKVKLEISSWGDANPNKDSLLASLTIIAAHATYNNGILLGHFLQSSLNLDQSSGEALARYLRTKIIKQGKPSDRHYTRGSTGAKVSKHLNQADSQYDDPTSSLDDY